MKKLSLTSKQGKNHYGTLWRGYVYFFILNPKGFCNNNKMEKKDRTQMGKNSKTEISFVSRKW